MANTRNRIHLRGTPGERDEREAAATITPGDLIEVTSAGTVQRHSTEGGVAERAFALEDALQGKSIDDDYAAGDMVQYDIFLPGTEAQGWLKAGENVAINDVLISDGAGKLIKEASAASATDVKDRVGVAREALDLSGSGDETTRIAVRVL